MGTRPVRRTSQSDHDEGVITAGPAKRLPGQSNADYEGPRTDPNAMFLGTQATVGGGDMTWVLRLVGWLRSKVSGPAR